MISSKKYFFLFIFSVLINFALGIFIYFKDENTSDLILDVKVLESHLLDVEKELILLSSSSDTNVANRAQEIQAEFEKIKKEINEDVPLNKNHKVHAELNNVKLELNNLYSEYQSYQNTITHNVIDMIELKERTIIDLHAQVSLLKDKFSNSLSGKLIGIGLDLKSHTQYEAKNIVYFWLNYYPDKLNKDKVYIKITDPNKTELVLNKNEMELFGDEKIFTYRYTRELNQVMKQGKYHFQVYNEKDKNLGEFTIFLK